MGLRRGGWKGSWGQGFWVRHSWTENKIKKYLKDGRGQGELDHYKPWLTVQDVPSAGRSHRIKGWKTTRIHHLLSDLERDYFYHLEWSEDVVDIREQYPLNRDTTVKISEDIDVNHPVDTHTKTPLVMTTDFLITVKSQKKVKNYARTLKYANDLKDRRTLEKFEVERKYWMENDIDWGIVTENEINRVFADNIKWLHNSRIINSDDHEYITPFLNQLERDRSSSIINFLSWFDEAYKCGSGTGLSIFKFLLAQKIIKLEMFESIKLNMSVDKLIVTNWDTSQERIGS